MRVETMLRTRLLVLAVIGLCVVSSGCVEMVGAMAGGGMLGVTAYLLDKQAQETLSINITDAEMITRRTYSEFGMTITKADPTRDSRDDRDVRRWTFEGGSVGDRVVMVDVVVSKISRDVTQVTVEADKGSLKPDHATAEAFMAEIRKSARELNTPRTARFGG
jgi:hypothetical protein